MCSVPLLCSVKEILILDFYNVSSRIISVVLGGRKMSDITRIALDAMGGDNAPGEIVKGAVGSGSEEKRYQDTADRKGGSPEKGAVRLYVSCGAD